MLYFLFAESGNHSYQVHQEHQVFQEGSHNNHKSCLWSIMRRALQELLKFISLTLPVPVPTAGSTDGLTLNFPDSPHLDNLSQMKSTKVTSNPLALGALEWYCPLNHSWYLEFLRVQCRHQHRPRQFQYIFLSLSHPTFTGLVSLCEPYSADSRITLQEPNVFLRPRPCPSAASESK